MCFVFLDAASGFCWLLGLGHIVQPQFYFVLIHITCHFIRNTMLILTEDAIGGRSKDSSCPVTTAFPLTWFLFSAVLTLDFHSCVWGKKQPTRHQQRCPHQSHRDHKFHDAWCAHELKLCMFGCLDSTGVPNEVGSEYLPYHSNKTFERLENRDHHNWGWSIQCDASQMEVFTYPYALIVSMCRYSPTDV